MAKIKIFESDNVKDLEIITNEFLKDKKVNSIQYNKVDYVPYSILIVYEEVPKYSSRPRPPE